MVAVDFNEGRPVYDYIRKAIEGKDIGILGNNLVGVLRCFYGFAIERSWG